MDHTKTVGWEFEALGRMNWWNVLSPLIEHNLTQPPFPPVDFQKMVGMTSFGPQLLNTITARSSDRFQKTAIT